MTALPPTEPECAQSRGCATRTRRRRREAVRGGWAVEGSGRRLDTSRCCTSLASNPAALSRVAGPAARLSRYKRCRLLPLVPGAWLFATVGVDMSATLPVNAASSAAAFQVRLPKAANNVAARPGRALSDVADGGRGGCREARSPLPPEPTAEQV